MNPLTEAEIRAALLGQYPDLRLDITPDPLTGRLSGTLVSEAFDGVQGPHRQQAVWGLLRAAYDERAATVGILALHTPAEMESRRVRRAVA